jgi:hypothetical protein
MELPPVANFTSDTPSESIIDPELLEANARILKLRQARQESRRLTQDTSTEYSDCTESTESTERIQKIQNDSEGFQKDPEGVDFVDRTPTSKTVDSPQTEECILNPTLPLKVFVAEAALRSIDASECSDNWKSPTWEFVRLCRTHPKLLSLTADQAFNKIPWSATGFDEEEQLTFIAEWDRVRSLPGMSPLHWAANLARQHPLISTRKHLKTYNEFVSLAGWLQVSVGNNNPIFLPTRKVAEILGLKSNATVATLCKIALADDLLELIERATQHRATRYQFRVECYEILRNWKD